MEKLLGNITNVLGVRLEVRGCLEPAAAHIIHTLATMEHRTEGGIRKDRKILCKLDVALGFISSIFGLFGGRLAEAAVALIVVRLVLDLIILVLFLLLAFLLLLGGFLSFFRGALGGGSLSFGRRLRLLALFTCRILKMRIGKRGSRNEMFLYSSALASQYIGQSSGPRLRPG